ncbi:hypothetical protein ACIQPQ_34605 [Streptomyces sp. NPDC091281]|uniref:hypothetical protein n=1 Tax=Streptomyces sp. NPDC091281 TaxID=3365985 RepID=UPI00380F9991
MTQPLFPKTFVVQRDQDVSGVSGEGVVAEGVRFSDGWVATHWLDKPPMHEPKTEVWHNPGTEPFEKISGHGGRTRIVWSDGVQAARRKLADVVEAFDVPDWVASPDVEREILRRRLDRAIKSAQDEGLAPAEAPKGIVDAVLLVVGQLQRERDLARQTAGRAYQLADRWEAAHGSAYSLVQVAGSELRETLDDDPTVSSEVVHPDPNPQVNDCATMGESGLQCVCGNPVQWTEHSFDPGWIHSPGSDATCTNARPYCPECRMPHLLVPGREPMCRSLRAHVAPDTRRDQTTPGVAKHQSSEHEEPDGLPDRQGCPYCTGAPQLLSSELTGHVRATHGRVLVALARGISLDELLHETEV